MAVPNSKIQPFHLPELKLFRPSCIDGVFELLERGAHVLAGGTDQLITASRSGAPRELAWIGNIDALRVCSADRERLRIGACVTLGELIRCADFRRSVPAVADGAQFIGSVQLRNLATLLGNVCTASPAGDTLPGLLVHDAHVEISAPANRHRTLALQDFLVGPGDTALSQNELAVGVSLCPLQANEASAYRRHTERRALDLAFAGVAARLAFEADGYTVAGAHLALGAVGPTALLADEAATDLVGYPLTKERRAACAAAAVETCDPISDFRASADYRRQLIRVLVGDVLTEVERRAGIRARAR